MLYKGSLEMIAEEIGFESAFGPCHNEYGNGVLSRFPIIEQQNWILKARSDFEHPR